MVTSPGPFCPICPAAQPAQPAFPTKAPALLKILIIPSSKHLFQTSSVEGTIFKTTPGAILRPFKIFATSLISSILPFVQLPTKPESIFV